MASYVPPIETLPIFDNSVFETSSSGSSLTVDRANLLYLRKTVADTATATETFNAGLKSSFVNPLTTSGSLLLSNSTNTGTIVIDTSNTGNTNAAPAISIGASAVVKTIKIGSSAVSNSVHLASLDVTGSSLNNYVGTTGAVSIGSSQTSGILNIGAGAVRTALGVINIGNIAGSLADINIGTSSCLARIGSRLVGGLKLTDSVAGTASFIGQGGLSLGWNYSGNRGESDLINMRGGGAPSLGGFNFYDQGTDGSIVAPDLIMAISRSATGIVLPTFGGVYVNSVSVANGIYLPATVATPLVGQLGYIVTDVMAADSALVSGGAANAKFSVAVGIGVWQLSYSMRIKGSGVVSNFTMMQSYAVVTPVSTAFPSVIALCQNIAAQAITGGGDLNASLSGSSVVNLAVAQTVTVYVKVLFTGGTPSIQGASANSQSYFSAVRIG